jgi:hypothetical protein
VLSSRRVRPGRLATTALAVLLLTGCGQNAPGVAAQVGNDRITDEQVDQLAEALCVLSASAPQAQQAQPVTSQQTRRQALQVLIDNALADDLIDPDAVDKAQVAAVQKQQEANLQALPERLRGSFDDTVAAFATTQLGLAALGRQSLLDKGTKKPDQQASLTEGQRLLLAQADKAGVTVDPRFGTFEDGQVGGTDGSLSVAVSDQAKASTGEADSSGDLPANLLCSAG